MSNVLDMPRTITTAAPRLDFYGPIHKALRAFMGDTLLRIGSMDGADEADVQATLGQLQTLTTLLRAHLHATPRSTSSRSRTSSPLQARIVGMSAGASGSSLSTRQAPTASHHRLPPARRAE